MPLALAAILVAAALTLGPRDADATARLVSISVTPSTVHARALVAKQLKALGTFDDGTQKDLTAQATWTSSDPATAAVSSKGVVTTLGTGTAVISATSSGVSGPAVVVVGAELVALRMSRDATTLRGGIGRTFHCVGTFSDGTRVPLRKELTWSSSDDTIAAFDDARTGLLIAANKLGTITITAVAPSATPDTALEASGQVTVSTLLESFILTPRTISVRVKKLARTRIKAIGSYSDGADRIDITPFVTFATSDKSIAVAQNRTGKRGRGIGVVSGVAPGTAEITATSTSTGVVGSNAVTVRVR
jgi:uncharacterized protein YjdB